MPADTLLCFILLSFVNALAVSSTEGQYPNDGMQPLDKGWF